LVDLKTPVVPVTALAGIMLRKRMAESVAAVKNRFGDRNVFLTTALCVHPFNGQSKWKNARGREANMAMKAAGESLRRTGLLDRVEEGESSFGVWRKGVPPT